MSLSHTALWDHLHNEHIPQFNAVLLNGLATEHLKKAIHMVDQQLREISATFPEGFVYEHIKYCTPEQEYEYMCRKHSNSSVLEISKSTVRLAHIQFSYFGKLQEPKPLYLPYANPGGLFILRDSVYSISPVLADDTISIGDGEVYVPLNGTRLLSSRLQYEFRMNNEPYTALVPYSKVYNRSAKGKESKAKSTVNVTAETCLVHYLLCRYGLVRTIEQYLGWSPIIGRVRDLENQLDTSQWIIFKPNGVRPRTLKTRMYQPADFAIAMPVDQFTPVSVGYIASIFYIIDHFPERVLVEYIGLEHEVNLWRTLLGFMIFGDENGEIVLLKRVNTHINVWLDKYLDDSVRLGLRQQNIRCNTIYDLMDNIVEILCTQVCQGANIEADLSGKKLMVLRYLMLDVVKTINNFRFALGSKSGEQSKKILTEKDIARLIRDKLNTEAIFDANKKHGEVTSVQYPGDNMVFKITSNVTAQSDATGGGGSNDLNDPSRQAHASQLHVCAFNNITKSDPSGRSKLRPTLKLGEDLSTVIHDPKEVPLIDEVQSKIARS